MWQINSPIQLKDLTNKLFFVKTSFYAPMQNKITNKMKKSFTQILCLNKTNFGIKIVFHKMCFTEVFPALTLNSQIFSNLT